MAFTILLDPKNPAGTSVEEENVSVLIQQGVISATTQIWDVDQGRWIDAQQHPNLRGQFALSVWDAWDEDSNVTLSSTISVPERSVSSASRVNKDDSKQENLQETSNSDEWTERLETFDSSKESIDTKIENGIAEPLLVPDVIAEEEIIEVEPFVDTDIALVEEQEEIVDMADLPLLSDSSLIPLDEVSSFFPKPEPTSVPKKPQINIPARRVRPIAPPEPQGFSFLRVGIPIVLGTIVIFVVLQLVQNYSQTSYRPRKNSTPVTEELVEKKWKEESEIRKLVGDDCLPVHLEASLEDALHIELQRAKIPAIQIEAFVTSWTGRKEDQPKNIRVRVQAESTGELDRDIATFGLIIGKYMETYFVDVEELHVCFGINDDEFLCGELNPEIVRRYYLKRIAYDRYFDDVIVEE